MPRVSATTSAAEFLPHRRNLPSLRKAAETCRGCPLYANATQTVFGEGPNTARAVFVGEQPGDVEDRAGRPFVGPAGRLFDELLDAAGIDRRQIYVTNAVKHFKWKPQGKRRLHAKPSSREIFACRPWLQAELEAIEPELLICLGATAAQSLLGRGFKLTQRRGEPFASDWADWTLATYHPSAVLRAKHLEGGEILVREFQADLELVAAKLK
ncbi:MAG TPA: UdgX family uracil-DNA binding protein [Pirellulaceae bacterium]|nr:UdgX family uracil-DNA binding protein [Pirellulaceae bacterium]